jgi:energy-coupling factor transporter transmembrane protein EcfT
MRAKVPKGLKNDKPLFHLFLDQWIVLLIFLFLIILLINSGFYEFLLIFIPLTPVFMFVKIRREKIWRFIFKVMMFQFRPKKVVRRNVFWIENEE